jgi:hypothetical protein
MEFIDNKSLFGRPAILATIKKRRVCPKRMDLEFRQHPMFLNLEVPLINSLQITCSVISFSHVFSARTSIHGNYLKWSGLMVSLGAVRELPRPPIPHVFERALREAPSNAERPSRQA